MGSRRCATVKFGTMKFMISVKIKDVKKMCAYITFKISHVRNNNY